MSPVPKRWFLVSVLVLSISTPWGILQSAAWFGMVVNYSRHVGFPRAIAMTFDGQHPCKLCHLIKEGQAKERPQEKDKPAIDQHLDFGMPPSIALWFHPFPKRCLPCPVTFAGCRREQPPAPPPRLA